MNMTDPGSPSAVAHDPFGTLAGSAPAAEPLPVPDGSVAAPSTPSAKSWIAGGVAAAVLGVGGFFAVGALASHTKSATSLTTGGGGGAPGFGPGGGGPGGGGVSGVLTSVNGSNLTITTAGGTTERVVTSSATTFGQSVKGSVSDIKVGDNVIATGTGTATVAATAITDSGALTAPGGPGGPGGPRAGGFGGPGGAGGRSVVAGKVTAVGNTSLDVTQPDGTSAALTISASTTVSVVKPSNLSALAVGQQVTVRGTTVNATITAAAVQASGSAGA